MPPDVLGHLMHRFQLQRPEELRMMMGEMSLSRGKQLLFGLSCELRPTFAEGDPSVAALDRGHVTLVIVA